MTARTLTAPVAGGEPLASPQAAEVVLGLGTLTPDAVNRVARRQARARLDPEGAERNRLAREAILQLLERGEPLYGASCGVGAHHDRAVSDEQREAMQWNLLRSHAVDAGTPLPEDVVRAAMTVRANQIGAGGAGVAPALLDRLVAALDLDGAPVVGALGSLGTGDLPALARIALHLLGSAGEDGWDDAVPELGARDALGFISSNALTVGQACLHWHDTRALLDLWLEVATLSFEAVDADPVVFAARVQEAAGGPGQIAVARRMREALGHAGTSDPRAAHPARIQRAYPFRVLPQVDGVTAEAIEGLRRTLVREVNARPENALIDGGRAWPNGNFHAAALAASLDALRSALAGSAALMAARVSALLDPALSGLPPFLAGTPGRDSGMMMLEYTAHAAAAEICSLALPRIAHPMPVSMGVESHASFAPVSASRLAEQLAPLRVLIATELVVALRALELSGRRPRGEDAARLYGRMAGSLPAGREDRDFGTEVQMATRLIEDVLTSG